KFDDGGVHYPGNIVAMIGELFDASTDSIFYSEYASIGHNNGYGDYYRSVYTYYGDWHDRPDYSARAKFLTSYYSQNYTFAITTKNAGTSTYTVGTWSSPAMNYSLAMPDYKVFNLKVTSSGGYIAQVVFNPGPQVSPEEVYITVNDEANRNCSIKAYNDNQFVELGTGNATVSYIPDSMVWGGKHMLVGYYCDQSFDGIDGNVTFTVDVTSVGHKSITEMVKVPLSVFDLKVTSRGGN
ncbi:hypothetical protein AB4F11_05435, partial [Francisella philomiragia]